MNLRESMRAAAAAVPNESTVDLDRIVADQRRTELKRRIGAGGLAVAGLVAALAVGVLRPAGPDGLQPAPPVAAVSTSPARPTPLRLTAAEVRGALPAYGAATWLTFADRSPVFAVMALERNQASLDALADDPCALAPGAEPGRRHAPSRLDVCTAVRVDGRAAWVRRWGYDPVGRPWTTPDTVVIEIFFPLPSGRTALLALSNHEGRGGGENPSGRVGVPFDIADSELAAIAADLRRAG